MLSLGQRHGRISGDPDAEPGPFRVPRGQQHSGRGSPGLVGVDQRLGSRGSWGREVKLEGGWVLTSSGTWTPLQTLKHGEGGQWGLGKGEGGITSRCRACWLPNGTHKNEDV